MHWASQGVSFFFISLLGRQEGVWDDAFEEGRRHFAPGGTCTTGGSRVTPSRQALSSSSLKVSPCPLNNPQCTLTRAPGLATLGAEVASIVRIKHHFNGPPVLEPLSWKTMMVVADVTQKALIMYLVASGALMACVAPFPSPSSSFDSYPAFVFAVGHTTHHTHSHTHITRRLSQAVG